MLCHDTLQGKIIIDFQLPCELYYIVRYFDTGVKHMLIKWHIEIWMKVNSVDGVIELPKNLLRLIDVILWLVFLLHEMRPLSWPQVARKICWLTCLVIIDIV